jgi:hypothetical protein
VIEAAALLEIGLTPEFLAMAVIVGLGSAAVVSFVIGGIAIAIVGPRRMDAVLLPGVVGFIVTIALVLLARDVALYWVASAAFASALLVAWLQKANIDDPTAASATGVFVVGRTLVGLLVGAAVGIVGLIFTQSPFALVLLTLIGAAIGLRWGLSAEPRPAEEQPPAAEPPPGMLDG